MLFHCVIGLTPISYDIRPIYLQIAPMDKVTYLGMQQHMVHLQHQQHMNKTLTHYIPTLKVPQVLSSNGQHLLDNTLAGPPHILDPASSLQNFSMMPTSVNDGLRPLTW